LGQWWLLSYLQQPVPPSSPSPCSPHHHRYLTAEAAAPSDHHLPHLPLLLFLLLGLQAAAAAEGLRKGWSLADQDAALAQQEGVGMEVPLNLGLPGQPKTGHLPLLDLLLVVVLG
jgi:hypothetical protein